MQTLLVIGTLAYAITTFGYLAVLFEHAKPIPVGPGALSAHPSIGSLHSHSGLSIYDSVSDFDPWLILSAWSLGLIFIYLKRKYPISAMGSFIAALSTVLCTFALLVSTREGRLVDGVMGDLVRFSHVGLAILGLTIFSLASAVSLLYLVVFDRLKRKKTRFLQAPMPALETLDTLGHRLVLWGFPFYTVALLLGTAEAMRSEASGLQLRYVLAAISWVIYAVVLQARLTAGWQGKRAAILTVSGLVMAFSVVGLYAVGAG